MIKASVLMSVYNEEDNLLKSSIESILNQSFKEFEFLIVDDQTCESNIQVIESFNDSRIKSFVLWRTIPPQSHST